MNAVNTRMGNLAQRQSVIEALYRFIAKPCKRHNREAARQDDGPEEGNLVTAPQMYTAAGERHGKARQKSEECEHCREPKDTAETWRRFASCFVGARSRDYFSGMREEEARLQEEEVRRSCVRNRLGYLSRYTKWQFRQP